MFRSRLRISNLLISAAAIATGLLYVHCVIQPKVLSPDRVASPESIEIGSPDQVVIETPIASGNSAKIDRVETKIASPEIKAPVASGNRIDGHLADLNLKTNGRTAASQPTASSQPSPTTQTAGDRSVQVAANQPQNAQTNQTGGLIQTSKTVQGLGTGSIAVIMAGIAVITYLKRSPLDRRSVERKIYHRVRKGKVQCKT